MYKLRCSDKTCCIGSTWNLEKRLVEHQSGLGANYTAKHLPVRLVYCEEFGSIDEAFYREKQIRNWSHAKEKALIDGDAGILKQKAKKDISKRT